MIRFMTGAVLAALLLAPTLVSATAFDVDPVHSSVTFKVRHLVSKVQGRFTEFSGTVDFDAENPANSKAQAVIKTASITTNNERRDNHLKSPDFFDAEAYPEITFKSTKVEAAGDGFMVTGDFTMHGVTKPITLDVEFLGIGDHPMGKGAQVAGFTATATINRQDWGVKWNKVFDNGGTLLSDEVELLIEVEAVHSEETSE
jgi:polyisoprenoid-binding protein YceI